MNARTVLSDMRAVSMGSVSASLHAMAGDEPTVVMGFRDASDICGVSVSFHASAADARTYGAELIRYADAADAAVEALARGVSA